MFIPIGPHDQDDAYQIGEFNRLIEPAEVSQ